METIGSYQAKTHLPQLLERVEHGETFTITRHGKPVARLLPTAASIEQPGIADAIAAMARFQEVEAPSLGGKVSVRELINADRRKYALENRRRNRNPGH
jgi:prevent-host-death family protein